MLELRPNCEHCDCNLPGDSERAWICSFECTFCAQCAHDRYAGRCPNCGGELVRRPRRPAAKLQRHPASTTRVHQPVRPTDDAAQAGPQARTPMSQIGLEARRLPARVAKQTPARETAAGAD